MNKGLQAGIFLAVAAIAGAAGYLFNHAAFSVSAKEAAVEKLLLARLNDLGGQTRSLGQSRGKVLVVNFWATWCEPCRDEIPILNKAHHEYGAKGVEFVGIALDNATKIREFAKVTPIDYALLIADANILSISKDLGNRAGVLPYTLIVNRAGAAAYTHAGALKRAELDVALEPLL